MGFANVLPLKAVRVSVWVAPERSITMDRPSKVDLNFPFLNFPQFIACACNTAGIDQKMNTRSINVLFISIDLPGGGADQTYEVLKTS